MDRLIRSGTGNDGPASFAEEGIALLPLNQQAGFLEGYSVIDFRGRVGTHARFIVEAKSLPHHLILDIRARGALGQAFGNLRTADLTIEVPWA